MSIWTTSPGVAVVGHGVSAPLKTRKRPDLCAEHDHPGVTYNPWLDKTWCLCGQIIRDGNQVAIPHAACCGGPLEERLDTAPAEAMELLNPTASHRPNEGK